MSINHTIVKKHNACLTTQPTAGNENTNLFKGKTEISNLNPPPFAFPEPNHQAKPETAIDLMKKLIASIKFEVRREVLKELTPLMRPMPTPTPTLEQLQINKLKTLEKRIERKISKRRKRRMIHK